MEHYVTLFDSLFLPQGLALHASMQRHLSQYTLWVLCIDDQTHEVLSHLNLPNVRLLQLSQLETDELLKVKSERSKGEYCWTITPFAPRFVFEADSSVQRVTYVDADLWFYKSPQPIFDEFENSRKQVLITDHAYAAEYDQSAASGKFCVQFMTFTRDGGEKVRKWWEERCIEWCHNRFEDGKFGDQKYLDVWPTKFQDSVHILSKFQWTLAPWNAIRFTAEQGIFFHFHGFRIINSETADIGPYPIPRSYKKLIYQPYTKDINDAITLLAKNNYKIKSQTNTVKNSMWSWAAIQKRYSYFRDSLRGKIIQF